MEESSDSSWGEKAQAKLLESELKGKAYQQTPKGNEKNRYTAMPSTRDGPSGLSLGEQSDSKPQTHQLRQPSTREGSPDPSLGEQPAVLTTGDSHPAAIN